MFRLEEEKNSRGTVMSGSAIRGRQGSERFFTLPAVTLIASSFVLGMSDFVVFLAGNILCALAPNYAVLPHYSHMAKVGFLPQFRMRAGNGCLSALRLRTIPGR